MAVACSSLLDEVHKVVEGPQHFEPAPLKVVFLPEVQKNSISALDNVVPIDAWRVDTKHSFHSRVEAENGRLVDKRVNSSLSGLLVPLHILIEEKLCCRRRL